MDNIKIHKSERHRKRENIRIKTQINHLTPPKLTDKRSVINTVRRWQTKFGYNYDCNSAQINPYLKQQWEQFHHKASRYCGGNDFAKKQTRFDKMKMKQQLGFKLQQLPFKKKFRRADQILANLFKKQALFTIIRST